MRIDSDDLVLDGQRPPFNPPLDAVHEGTATNGDHEPSGFETRESTIVLEEKVVAEADGDIDGWRRRLKARELALAEQAQELDRLERELEDRIAAFAEREAIALVQLDLKEEEIESREAAARDLEQRLQRKEEDLNRYVGQLQSRLAVAD
jgi:hypothetical protein